ncbi:MAG: ATP-binding cassette domain-containing protein [Lachnospiraceae bacterium]|nr:ATP-binding cassette domain-containing protein [Lachnospiraceae bacterium]
MNDRLHVSEVNKIYGKHHVLKDISCEVKKGEFISLLGPSGCGKTTLLRIIMGLEQPTSGKLFLDETDITDVRPANREFSIVFQEYALFPHMTLYDNVAYGLKLRKMAETEIRERVMEVLTMLKLDASVKKYPSQMSGGMQQRTAIARCLVLGSNLMLLDEPFSALDAMVRVDLSEELKELQKQFGITMIMVTHDQEEAFSLSDRILLMDHGVLIADAPPAELYRMDDVPFVKTFIIDQLNKRAGYLRQLILGQ